MSIFFSCTVPSFKKKEGTDSTYQVAKYAKGSRRPFWGALGGLVLCAFVVNYRFRDSRSGGKRIGRGNDRAADHNIVGARI